MKAASPRMLWSGHLRVMPHRSTPAWRQLRSSGRLRRSSPKALQIYNPRNRRRASWAALAKPELALLMHGLSDWEERSRGAVKVRIRRKRIEAVAFFSRKFGGIAPDRYAVGKRMHKSIRQYGLHRPEREREWGVLWHEA
jgi:hypothetical protein